ncbi:MAG: hypothetical protein H6R17_476 [Proteobacteria bacterium]|nr:hypothetical protein [Pseudomonadota bacterium]
MNQTFHALLKEAAFTKEMLSAGASEIRNANYATKGVYFQSFISLSTGLERIGKLSLILDYYIRHSGKFPGFEFLKKEIGHKLVLLYQKSQSVVIERGFQFSYLKSLSDPTHTAIMDILHSFAEGDRYANINYLVGSFQTDDPISRWFKEVDLPIFEKRVSIRKKAAIFGRAVMLAEAAKNWAVLFHTTETGSELTDFEEASIRTGIFESVRQYRQFYVLQIIRYWVELLGKLEGPARAIGREEIPYFSEIFAIFYNDDALFRSRKTW